MQHICVLGVCMSYFHMKPHKLLEAALRALVIVTIVPSFLNGGECKRRKLEQSVPDTIHKHNAVTAPLIAFYLA